MTDKDEVLDAFDRISAESQRVKDKRSALRQAEERLDATIAGLVSEEPVSPVWYAKPGILTREQACSAAGLTAVQLDKLMSRHRARFKKPKTKKRG